MSNNFIPTFRIAFFLCLSCGNLLLAQSGALSLSSSSVTTGGTASITVSLSGGSSPSDMQWTLTYPSSAVTAVNVTAGPVLTAASKSLSCSAAPGAYTCLASALNTTAIADGLVATVSLTLDSAGTISVGLTNTMGASPAGSTIPMSGTGGTIVVTPAVSLSSAACSPSSLVTPGTSLCTVTLSAEAPAGGAAVTLSSNQTSLTVPASVTVAAGSTSGTFTASAATVSTNQTATITATLTGNSASAILTLVPPTAPPVTAASLACSPSSVSPGASITCTIILSGVAPPGGAVVLLTSSSSALTAPTSVTVPAGSTSTTFTPDAGTVAAAQTATLTASLGGSSLTNSLVLNPAGGPPILNVGPGQTYSTPCLALAVAPAGAIIQIDASGTYSGDVCTINASNITLKGVNGRPRIDAAGQYAASNGTWVFEGNNITVDTIELTGATTPQNNGAAICMEGQNLTVLNSYIHDNQEGVFVNPEPSGQILVQSTEFNHNGFGDGLTHNLHVNAAARLTVQYSYSHNANAGDLIETGASENYILYNRLTSETGTTSAETDIANGGRSFVIGNLIEKGANDQSGTVLGYLDGGSSGSNSSTELYVVNNTFVNDRSSGATFLAISSADPTPAVLMNNILYGTGTITTQSNAALNANLTSNPLFVNQAGYDYHLTSGSPAIGAGANLGAADGVSLVPAYEYLSPSCAEVRNMVNAALDIGGYEFDGAGAPLPCSVGLSALSLAPNTVIGGSPASATVTLSNPAPAGGTPVVISTSNSSVAAAPASVTISSGALSAVFSVTTASVTSTTGVTISASYGGATQTAILTVVAPALSLQCNATSLQSGATSTCTIALSSTAPTGGVTVTLSSNTAALTVPASVTVGAGSTTATFTAATGTIASNQTATITATLNGSTQTATVSLVAPVLLSGLTCSPSSLGSGSSATCTVTVTQTGGATVTLSSNATALTVPASVAVGSSSTTASFKATAGTITSNQTATITATLNGSTQTDKISLAAPVLLSGLTCSPTSLSSGGTSVCTVTLTPVASTGGVSVSLSDNSSSLSAPTSVTVAAGSTSATFSVTAGSISSSTNAKLTAKLGTISKSVTLRLNR